MGERRLTGRGSMRPAGGGEAPCHVYSAGMRSLNQVVDRLSANLRVFDAILRGVDSEQAVWRPANDAWSMLEVVCHLIDEEREDFRARLSLVLEDPATAWPPIDPRGWVTSRAYAGRDYGAMADTLLAERAASIVWLRGLRQPPLSNARSLNASFTLSGGDLLMSWLAHDFLHLRQINELHYAWHARASAPLDVRYAGDW